MRCVNCGSEMNCVHSSVLGQDEEHEWECSNNECCTSAFAYENHDGITWHINDDDNTIFDRVGGYHYAGVGHDPNGYFCGECSRATCEGRTVFTKQ